MKKSNHDFFQQFLDRFTEYSDTELINAFNSQVGNQGTGSAKMGFLSALRSQLDSRDINREAITNPETSGLSYAKKVSLYVINGQKIIKPID